MRERTAFPREVLERAAATEAGGHHRDAQRLARRRTTCASAACVSAAPGCTGARRSGRAEHGRGGVGADPRHRASASTLEDRALRAGHWQLGLPRTWPARRWGWPGWAGSGGAMVAPARVFGMDVIAWSENLTAERAAELRACAGLQGRAASELRRAVDPPGAQRPHPRPVRRRRARADEADRRADQHLSRTDRRRTGADRSAARRARSPRPGSTCTTSEPLPPTTSCCRSRTPCCSRTSATSASRRSGRCTPRWSPTSPRFRRAHRSGY